MKEAFLGHLRCPQCLVALRLEQRAKAPAVEVETGTLTCGSCSNSYPIVNGTPRFVPSSNYADNFGFQWNHFSRTQLDSHSGTTITADRFFTSTGWRPEELAGKLVLDVGCGAGRFAEIALRSGAELVALDYSSAIDAARRNLAGAGRLHTVQGDVFTLPFADASFDYVYCLGVLQHTPDVAGAFRALAAKVKPGGKLAIDVYPRLLRNILSSKDWVRPITRRMNSERLFRLCERWVPRLLPVSRLLGGVPYVGRQLRRLIPVTNYDGIFPLSEAQQREWALLDTYDMLAPRYDSPQSANTVKQWFDAAGYEDVEVFRHGHLIGRGTRPA